MDTQEGESPFRFVNFDSAADLYGSINNQIYSRSLGLTEKKFYIGLPPCSAADHDYLLVGEHVYTASDVEQIHKTGNQSSYLYYLPAQGSVDKREYLCAPMLIVKKVSKKQAFQIGKQLFDNLREIAGCKKILGYKETKVNGYSAFLGVAMKATNPEHVLVFYNVSFSQRLHVSFIQIIPKNQLPPKLDDMSDESYFSDLHSWMSSFGYDQ